MSRNATFWLFMGLAACLGLMLRCGRLDDRPMHNDEAVNAIKFRSLWEHGIYKYDPNEYHGPSLFYLTFAWNKLTGAPEFARFDEGRLRIVTALLGTALILLLPLARDGLGTGATVAAAFLTAASPVMVYYSRDYIHEMPLAVFTWLGLAAGWRYACTGRPGWILLAGGAAGLMHATKETFVFPLAAAAVALALTRLTARNKPPPFTIKRLHWVGALGIWAVAALLLFSSFLTNAAGPLDAFRTYLPWLNRAQGSSPHVHEWSFYMRRLLFFHADGGPIWSEGLILALAIAGSVSAFRTGATFLRFLAFYTGTLTFLYCVLPYKTPWCVLGFWQGAIVLAGAGATALPTWTPRVAWRFAAAAAIAAGTAQLAWQATQAAGPWSADRGNPWVYAQTSRGIFQLTGKVASLAAISPARQHTVIKVIARGDDYWPLPWYFRAFDNCGWWPQVPPDPYAPIILASSGLHADLDNDRTHVMAGIFQTRPGIFFELYVQADLWKAYLAAPRNKDEDN